MAERSRPAESRAGCSELLDTLTAGAAAGGDGAAAVDGAGATVGEGDALEVLDFTVLLDELEAPWDPAPADEPVDLPEPCREELTDPVCLPVPRSMPAPCPVPAPRLAVKRPLPPRVFEAEPAADTLPDEPAL